jgi:hypothetical protein
MRQRPGKGCRPITRVERDYREQGEAREGRRLISRDPQHLTVSRPCPQVVGGARSPAPPLEPVSDLAGQSPSRARARRLADKDRTGVGQPGGGGVADDHRVVEDRCVGVVAHGGGRVGDLRPAGAVEVRDVLSGRPNVVRRAALRRGAGSGAPLGSSASRCGMKFKLRPVSSPSARSGTSRCAFPSRGEGTRAGG